MRKIVPAIALLLAISGLSPAEAGLVKISGRVTDAEGNPAPGICVGAAGVRHYFGAVTGQTGSFLLDVDPGVYRVRFSECSWPRRFRGEWYDDARTEFEARPVVAVVGQTRGINVVLERLGSISGTVRAHDASPMSGVCVRARDANGSNDASALTDAHGAYRLVELDAGPHVVSFEDCRRSGTIYSPEWHDDAHDAFAADPVEVRPGEDTSGIDATLDIGGSISGTITDASGNLLDGICVSAQLPDRHHTVVTHDGVYTIRGLLPSDYLIRFVDCAGDRFRAEWYDDATFEDDATAVSVALGHTRTIDAVLAAF